VSHNPPLLTSPVNNISMAAFLLTPDAKSGTLGVEQKSPSPTPGVEKRAVSLSARARSQDATSWRPAPVAAPPTLARVGMGQRFTAIIVAWQRSNRSSWERLFSDGATPGRWKSLMSWPEQNTLGSEDFRTMTLAASGGVWKCSLKDFKISRLNADLRLGLSIVNVSTPRGQRALKTEFRNAIEGCI